MKLIIAEKPSSNAEPISSIMIVLVTIYLDSKKISAVNNFYEMLEVE